MRRPFPLSPILTACLLSCIGSSVWALSLGPIDATATIGKPFIATVPVIEADGHIDCIKGDLLYGETLISATSVKLRGNTAQIRSNRPVDEPIITLTLNVGCDNPISRSYTLFAEMPAVHIGQERAHLDKTTEPRKTQTAGDTAETQYSNFFGIEVQPNITTPVSVRKKTGTASATARGTSHVKAKPESTPSNTGLSIEHTASKRLASPPIQTWNEANTPRLELDSTDPATWMPNLQLTDTLISSVSADPQAREDARAQWQAINAQLNHEIQGLQATQAAIAQSTTSPGLQADLQHQQKEIERLKLQVQQEQHSNQTLRIVLYSIGGLLLLGFGVLAYQRLRTRRKNKAQTDKNSAWWQSSSTSADTAINSTKQTTSRSASVSNLTAYVQELPTPEVTFEPLSSSEFAALEELDPRFTHTPPTLTKETNTTKAAQVKAEGLQAAQEQADFYAALGKFEQAEELLRNYIQQNPATSPLAYLNLLSLYHSAEKQAKFEALRQHFNQVFNAQIPDFERYRLDPRGLESYPETMEQIQQYWGRSEVIPLIEDALFRRSEGHQTPEDSFAPMAYRELLLLYSIAVDTTATSEDIARIQTTSAQATKWLQPATMPLGLADTSEGTASGSDPFNTGPSPLAKDGWEMDDSRPPEHLDLDLNLDLETDRGNIDFELPSEAEAFTVAPDTINTHLDGKGELPASPYHSESSIDLNLNDDSPATILVKHPPEDQT